MRECTLTIRYKGPKSVAVEVPKKTSTRKKTTPKKYECQKCHRCFAYAACRNNHQEKCCTQTEPIEEPMRGKKVKRSMDEDRMPPNKLKLLKCKKDKMLKKKNKQWNKAFFMNRQKLHRPPPSPTTNKEKIYIPLSPRTISCHPWTMIASIPSFGF